MAHLRRAAFLCSGVALVITATRDVSADIPATVYVATTPGDTFAEAYYAVEQGLFRKAGLNVEVTTFGNPAALAAAVSGGSVDFGVASPLGIAQAVARGTPFTIVAAGALNTAKDPSALLVVAKNSTLRTAKDFEGKTIAVNALKSQSGVVVDAWLAQGGADISKIHLAELPFSEMPAALEDGTVEGALLGEPVLSLALQRSVKTLADANLAVAPQYLLSAWFTTSAYAQKNPDLIRRFRTAIYDAGRWANKNHAATAPILAKYANVDVGVIRTMQRAAYTDKLLPADIQPQLDLAAKYGIIPHQMTAAQLLAH